ncbi:MAG TPA: lipid A deacylase LpxR family protein [Thermoanaerobaculia bacterium]|nr:lipid A deacylase LpxR family protein [Thermoanaerobaculia bacterium]
MNPRVAVCLTLAVASAWAAHAQTTRTFTGENDLFAGTDQHYTNGLRYSAVRGNVGETPWWGREIARDLGVCGTEQGNEARTCFRVDRGYAITHTIYTPTNIDIAAPIPGDRPYGGWLHYTTMFDLQNDTDKRVHHHFEADFGVTGDWSLAEDIQTEWHEIINSDPPMGWDNQIDNSLTFLLLYRYRKVVFQKFNADEDIRLFDFAPHAVGAFGNVFTYGGAGITARLGYNIPKEFHDGIEPTAAGSAGSSHPLSVFVFAGAEGRAVGRNVFLDGNRSNGLSVDKEPFVSDLSAGLAVGYKRLLVSYRLVQRSREFEGQLDPLNFGSIAITWRPWT